VVRNWSRQHPIESRPQTRCMTSATAFPELWSADRLADHLGTSTDFVYTLVAERKIGHHRIGKLVRFTAEHIQTYLDSVHVPVETLNTGRRADLPPRTPSPAVSKRPAASAVRNVGGRPRTPTRAATSSEVFS